MGGVVEVTRARRTGGNADGVSRDGGKNARDDAAGAAVQYSEAGPYANDVQGKVSGVGDHGIFDLDKIVFVRRKISILFCKMEVPIIENVGSPWVLLQRSCASKLNAVWKCCGARLLRVVL